MWSLTSQRERRTSGPENFQSSAKKDFFNTIVPKADISRFMTTRPSLPSLAPLLQGEVASNPGILDLPFVLEDVAVGVLGLGAETLRGI